MSRASAPSISRRTKSDGSSSRREPAAFAAASQRGPITTSMMAQASNASSMARRKSTAPGIPSTSRKTAALPNAVVKRS